MSTLMNRSVAEALVGQLRLQGVDQVFCVPGESYLPVLEALRASGVTTTVCRQEGGATMMAEAVGKATGRPGVVFVTRGPGATNAAAGVHVAAQDSTPMILFVGQIRRGFRERDAWQELDYRRVFGGLAKWATELDDPERVGEVVARAFHVALSGRPGPVVVALPSDLLPLPSRGGDAPRVTAPELTPSAADLERLRVLLAQASRPILILGGARWTPAARADAARFAARFEVPLAASHRRGGLCDPDDSGFAGELGLAPNPALVARVRSSDLVILLGGRLGEVPSQGYSLIDIPTPQMPLVHIYPDAEELGRVYQPALAIAASPVPAAAALAELEPLKPPTGGIERQIAHQAYRQWSEVATPQPGPVNLGEIIVWLRGALQPDAVLCNGAGNFAGWINRFHRVRGLDGHIAPTSGSMGYGVPAAIAVKRLYPDRQVVAVSGDGDFLMTGQEFATAVQYGLNIIVIVVDNRSYGTIRMHQERDFPGKVFATDLVNPDFAAYARAFGGFGAVVERTDAFEAAFRAAEASQLPSILHLKVCVEAISAGATLSAVRDQARPARSP